MIFNASDFVFKPPAPISRARRILIKPSAGYPLPYPVTASAGIISVIIDGIRRVSDADILILEGTPDGQPIFPVYQALKYNFPRVLKLDVRDIVSVEVDNPLNKPLAVPTFWIPNVVLSSDYLISVAPLKVVRGEGYMSITNLLSLLPVSKYKNDFKGANGPFAELGFDKVMADLYFTLPFDLGVIEARKKFIVDINDPTQGKVDEAGKILVGEPYEVDREAAALFKIKTGYLNLIESAKVEIEG